MKVKIKKLHSDAVIPKYAKVGDAGLDLTATSRTADEFGNIVYTTGLSLEIPEGHVGLIFPRSSISKYDLVLCNHVPVIDSSYRGEIILKFNLATSAMNKVVFSYGDNEYLNINQYNVGDRIGQIIILPYPQIELEEVEELSETERGSGGWGSSGT